MQFQQQKNQLTKNLIFLKVYPTLQATIASLEPLFFSLSNEPLHYLLVNNSNWFLGWGGEKTNFFHPNLDLGHKMNCES